MDVSIILATILGHVFIKAFQRELHRDSDIDSDSDDVKPSGLRSAVVPVSKSLSTDHESSANHANEETIDRPKKNDKNGERQNGDDDKEKSEEKVNILSLFL